MVLSAKPWVCRQEETALKEFYLDCLNKQLATHSGETVLVSFILHHKEHILRLEDGGGIGPRGKLPRDLSKGSN